MSSLPVWMRIKVLKIKEPDNVWKNIEVFKNSWRISNNSGKAVIQESSGTQALLQHWTSSCLISINYEKTTFYRSIIKIKGNVFSVLRAPVTHGGENREPVRNVIWKIGTHFSTDLHSLLLLDRIENTWIHNWVGLLTDEQLGTVCLGPWESRSNQNTNFSQIRLQ